MQYPEALSFLINQIYPLIFQKSLKFDEKGQLILDLSALEGAYDQQTGEYLEPALPLAVASLDQTTQQDDSIMLPSQLIQAFSYQPAVPLKESAETGRGIEIVIIHRGDQPSFEEELANDVLEIITVFSGKALWQPKQET